MNIARTLTRTLVLIFHDPEQSLAIHTLGNHDIVFTDWLVVMVRRSGVWTMRRFHPTMMRWFVPRGKKPIRIIGFARYSWPHILDRSQQTVNSPNDSTGIKELTPSTVVPPGLAICRSAQDVERMKSATSQRRTTCRTNTTSSTATRTTRRVDTEITYGTAFHQGNKCSLVQGVIRG